MSLLKCKWNHVTPLLSTLQSLLISEQRQCIYNGQMLPSDLSFDCFWPRPSPFLPLPYSPLLLDTIFFFFFSWQNSSGFFPPQGLCICCFLCWRHSSSSEKDYFLTSSDLTSSVKMPSSLVKSSLIIPHKIKPPVLQHPLSSLPEFIVLHCVGHNKCVIHLFVEFCFTYRNASSRKVGTSWSISFITVSSIPRKVISTWLTGDTIGIG